MMHSKYHGDWFCGPEGLFSLGHYGGIFHLIIWGVLLFVLYRGINHLFLGNPGRVASSNQENDSIAILEKRYASGEINQEEFLRVKKDLGG